MSTSAIVPARQDPLPPTGPLDAAAPRGARASRIEDRFVAGAGRTSAAKQPSAPGQPTAARKPSSSSKAPPAKATPSKPSSSKAASLPKELAFLNDPKMSVQEKVFRFMLYLQEKYDRKVEEKLRELGNAKASSSSGAGKKGWLDQALGFARKLVPGLDAGLSLLENPAFRKIAEQVSGPVLAAAATAMGFPELAPLLTKLGPGIVDGLAKLQDGAKGSGSGAAGASTGSTSKAQDGADEQRVATELQYLLEKQRTTAALLSACLRSMHDTTMSVVGNIR